jgi:S1-C subfamily serine protease
VRAYVGVTGMTAPLPRRFVRFYRLARETGVMVTSVEPGSPGDKAGMTPRDIIVAYGDSPVGAADDLHRFLTEEQIGAKAELTVIGATERLRLEVVPSKSTSFAAIRLVLDGFSRSARRCREYSQKGGRTMRLQDKVASSTTR